MPLYLTVSRGERADQAIPILASSDQRVIDTVLQTIAQLNDGNVSWDDASRQPADTAEERDAPAE
jgi:hypothetical protein